MNAGDSFRARESTTIRGLNSGRHFHATASDFGNRQSGMGLGVDWLGGDSGAGGNRGGAESGREDGEIYGIGAASAGIVAAFSTGDAQGRRPARPLVWLSLIHI